MPQVCLGNPRPIINGQPHADPGAVTVINVAESRTLEQAIRDVAHDDGTSNTGLWRAHSLADAPLWVESTSAVLAQALADRFGCPIGRPADAVVPDGVPGPLTSL